MKINPDKNFGCNLRKYLPFVRQSDIVSLFLLFLADSNSLLFTFYECSDFLSAFIPFLASSSEHNHTVILLSIKKDKCFFFDNILKSYFAHQIFG